MYVMVGKKEDIVKAVSNIKTVLKHSVEYVDDELLFTATSDVSAIANEKLAEVATIKDECNAEAGDPADLM